MNDILSALHGIGYQVRFEPYLDVPRPKLERTWFPRRQVRNLTAEERNAERVRQWEAQRRAEFPSYYRMQQPRMLVFPMWMRPVVERALDGRPTEPDGG